MNCISKLVYIFIVLSVSACNLDGIDNSFDTSVAKLKEKLANTNIEAFSKPDAKHHSLNAILDDTKVAPALTSDFSKSLSAAVRSDPEILKTLSELAATEQSVVELRAQKNFQVETSILAGAEDITDKIAGAAVVLTVDRPIYDFGELDSRISAEEFAVLAAISELGADQNREAFEKASVWVEFERNLALLSSIQRRLEIVRPILEQLETASDAGVGSIQQVASAEGTISNLLVESTRLEEKYEQSKLNFVNAFGSLPSNYKFDDAYLEKLAPSAVTKEAVLAAPAIQAAYAQYRADVASFNAIAAEDKFKVALQARASRPFGGSNYGSDETLGIVLSKKLFDGGALDAKKDRGSLIVEASMNRLKSVYRETTREAKSAYETLGKIKETIKLADANIATTQKEIEYQKQQFIIGASTLESILGSEARLYRAEAQRINYAAELRLSYLRVTSILGLLYQDERTPS